MLRRRYDIAPRRQVYLFLRALGPCPDATLARALWNAYHTPPRTVRGARLALARAGLIQSTPAAGRAHAWDAPAPRPAAAPTPSRDRQRTLFNTGPESPRKCRRSPAAN